MSKDYSHDLIQLYKKHFQQEPLELEELRAHGSNRRLFRLSDGDYSAIGVGNEDHDENVAFLEFSRHFRKHALPVPEIYLDDLQNNIYLEEDSGDTTLFSFLSEDRKQFHFSDQVIGAYRKVVRILPKFQIEAGEDLNYEVCYPRSHFDKQSMMWDLNYFKYYFLKLAHIPFNEQELENDFESFVSFLLQTDHDYFLYRDFQSRNIMLKGGEPYFIDYQGGRRGALQYDMASLLFDAKAAIPFDVREMLLDEYLTALSEYENVDRQSFLQYYYGYVLIRIMQAMGAYGFRGFYERKTHFLQSVPYAIRNLEFVLRTAELPVELPTLMNIWHRLVQSSFLRELGSVQLPLTLRIQSFSFKNGLPKDETGHGGGFIFDCRALPNPGRHQEYADLNGQDPEVIAFLENNEEVHSFITHVRDIVIQSVENYQKRNFTDLTVAFGCTGGQHRSVFCADRLAKQLGEKYDLKIEVKHRERESWPANRKQPEKTA